MNSTESAYGIFTFKTSPQGEAIALGDECRLADYYLNCWKGRYLITITGLDVESTSKAALVSLARLVENRLLERGLRPGLVPLLPEADQDPQSVKYFKGPLALYNSYPFFREDAFAFQEGIKVDYKTGCSLFFLKYPSEEAAKTRFSGVRRKFAAEPRYREVQWDGKRLSARDNRERAILAGQLGKYIVIVLGENDRKSAEDLLVRVDKRLAAKEEE